MCGFARVQDDHCADDRARAPADSSRSRGRLPLVPAERSFQLADILDLCLDLGDEEDVADGSVAKHIDPAVTPPVDDLDLAPNLPARRRQAARHIGDAGSMSGLSLAKTIRKKGGFDAKRKAAAKGVIEATDHTQIDAVDQTTLDPRGGGL